MIDIHIVIVDNGEIEPELWVFESIDKADQFAAVRGGIVSTIGIQNDADATVLIDNEIRLATEGN